MNVSKVQELKIKVGLLEPKLNIDDISVGDIIYSYNIILGDIQEILITTMTLESIRFMISGFYGHMVKLFKSEKHAQNYKNATDEISKIIDEEMMERTRKQINQFADVSKMGLGESYEFDTSPATNIFPDCHAGMSNLFTNVVDNQIVLKRQLSSSEKDEMRLVIKHYKNRLK